MQARVEILVLRDAFWVIMFLDIKIENKLHYISESVGGGLSQHSRP